MKARKIIIAIALFFIATGILPAQEPTTTWPYEFYDFQKCTVYFKKGGNAEHVANIHLLKSQLHMVNNGNVFETNSGEILMVVFGETHYMNINNSLMKVVAENKSTFVAKHVEIDFTRLNETSSAYGIPASTSSTKALTSIEGFGTIPNHMMQRADKDSGKPLVFKEEYFIVTNGATYPADKKILEKILPEEKKVALKAFMKQNKIKWTEPQSLLKLGEFFQ